MLQGFVAQVADKSGHPDFPRIWRCLRARRGLLGRLRSSRRHLGFGQPPELGLGDWRVRLLDFHSFRVKVLATKVLIGMLTGLRECESRAVFFEHGQTTVSFQGQSSQDLTDQGGKLKAMAREARPQNDSRVFWPKI